MKHAEVVELDLPGGGAVLVHALPLSAGGDELDREASGPSNVGLREALSFSAVSTALRGVAASIHDGVKAVKPDVVEAEFGFEFAMKGSQLICLLADGEAKATLRVRLEWQNGPASRDS
ncbi:CU044_2847 family protein [Streptomyces sp. NPDC002668]|uniref:CU044_2847 family protein n=1 Tax=Streptomyces sp. NPDC002668 TaxID=3154422 RepID=UPI00331D7A64